MSSRLTIPLAGPSGEPVDLWRTIMSHGVADLPPAAVDETARSYVTTVALPRVRARTLTISEGRKGSAWIEVHGPKVGAKTASAIKESARRMLNLDEDLSGFYAVAAADPDLAWAAKGAGRMLRPPTVFETVTKTICTTNTAWSATVRMVTALVQNLGEPSAGRAGRAFPTPEAMASQSDRFYRDTVRAGYRGPYLRAVAHSVAEGTVDLERLAEEDSLSDDELASRLLALPGVGPYAAAHIMMLLGRHSRLILDSWTRPKYAGLRGRKASDAQIVRRFRSYGEYAGLAFWLFLTRDWVSDEAAAKE
jgi:3-methyladenine DNA glycosylase/8-oxoguanine DNA glycosylase